MARKKRCKSGASPQAIRRAAVRIADTDGMVHSIDKRRWEVASESSPGSWYMVAVTEGGIACDCPYSANRGGAPCKHSVAVELILLREAGTIQSEEQAVLEEIWICCTKCGSTRHRRDGIRSRKRREDGQRYRCLNGQCGARFTDGLGYSLGLEGVGQDDGYAGLLEGRKRLLPQVAGGLAGRPGRAVLVYGVPGQQCRGAARVRVAGLFQHLSVMVHYTDHALALSDINSNIVHVITSRPVRWPAESCLHPSGICVPLTQQRGYPHSQERPQRAMQTKG